MAVETLSHGQLTWTNLINPTAADTKQLAQAYPQFHPLDLEDLLSHIERPKIDEYDTYLFIVMQFPVWDRDRRLSRSSEVDIFVGSGFVVTAHAGDLKPLVNLFSECQNEAAARNTKMSSAGRLLHAIIDGLVDYIFPILHRVDQNIRGIEEVMFVEDTRQTLQTMSFVRRDIIALRRIIRPQVSIISNLEQVDRPYIKENLDVYFGDILDHVQKARDIVEDDADVIAGLADTSDALASHRINEVMRILTVISVIMLPLTLISGILGMNIPLPLAKAPYTFWGTMGVMLLITTGMLLYFRHRNWL